MKGWGCEEAGLSDRVGCEGVWLSEEVGLSKGAG